MVLKQKIILVLLIIIGTLFQIAPVIRSGLQYNYGYGFWGPNGHDGVWHLSLINHIDNPVKINMPTFSGETLSNYHPFFDILIKFFSQVTFIPSSIWLFQIFPTLSSVLFLALSFSLGKTITRSYLGGISLLILNFSSTSLGWLVNLVTNHNLSGESMFWAMQSPSNQINPPFFLSLIFILIIFNILAKITPNNPLSIKNSIIILTLLTLLPITKAYSALIGFGFYGMFSLISLLKYKQKSHLILVVVSIISATSLFFVFNKSSASLFVFKPFWFLDSMIDSPDKFYFPKLSSLRNTLLTLKYFDLRLIVIYLSTFIIFIIGNFSWRLLGFLTLLKQNNYFKSTIFLLIIVQILIPTLFIQKGTSWNTIQFLYYSMFLANILLCLYLSTLTGIMQKTLYILILISNFAGLTGMLPNYLGKIPPASLPISEINALKYLSLLPSGTVLTAPYDQYLKNSFNSTPIPLYAYETTSYVSAYSKKTTFVDDYMNLANSGYDYLPRVKQSTDFFTQKNVYQDRGFLINNNISYIYLTGLQTSKYKLDTTNLYLKEIYNQDNTSIYQVLK